MSCYDIGGDVKLVNKIAFDETQLRRVLARLGIKMEVQESQVLLESSSGNNGWYLDMVRV